MDYGILTGTTIRARATEKLAQYSAQLSSDNELGNAKLRDFFLQRLINGIDIDSKSSLSQREVENVLALSKYLEYAPEGETKTAIGSKLSTVLVQLPLLSTSGANGASVVTQVGRAVTRAVSTNEATLLAFLDNLKSGGESPLQLNYYFALIGFLEALTGTTISPTVVKRLLDVLTAQFFINVELCMSEIADIHEQYALSVFETEDSEFSSLLVMKLFKQLLVEYLKQTAGVTDKSLLQFCIDRQTASTQLSNGNGHGAGSDPLLRELVETNVQDVLAFEAGSNDILLSTYTRQQMATAIQCLSLEIVALGVHEGVADPAEIESLARGLANDPVKVAYHPLAETLFGFMTMLSLKNRKIAYLVCRKFPSVLLSQSLTPECASNVATFVATTLNTMPQEDVISTIYSITNILAPGSDLLVTQRKKSFRGDIEPPKRVSSSHGGSIRSIDSATRSIRAHTAHSDFGFELTDQVYENVLAAALSLCRSLDDESMSVLMVTILCQKFGSISKPVDILLLRALGDFMPFVEEREFLHIFKLFNESALRTARVNDEATNTAIVDLWASVSAKIAQCPDSDMFRVYLHEMLVAIANRGDDIQDLEHHRSNTEVSAVAREIAVYFKPLAYLLPSLDTPPTRFSDLQTINLFKDAWFNVAVHGISTGPESSEASEKPSHGTAIGMANKDHLRRIAYSTPPLADEYSWSRTETSIELNSVLRRGTSKHIERLHKTSLARTFPPKSLDSKVFEIKISRPKLMFLAATLLVEDLRVEAGDCATALTYFSDPSVAITGIQRYIGNIAVYVTSKFIRLINRGGSELYAMDNVSEQLKKMLIFCCHRDYELQDAAFQCCHHLIHNVPSALCHHTSLFCLLDLLSLLFQSTMDADLNEYEPNVKFHAPASNITLSLSDSYEWRRSALQKLHKYGTAWTRLALSKCNYDMKSLLQAYISQIGLMNISNIHFGVSFALEMAGSVLPVDRELSNLGGDGFGTKNTLAGFLSQFQWRNSFKNDILIKVARIRSSGPAGLPSDVRRQLQRVEEQLHNNASVADDELMNLLGDCTAIIILSPGFAADFIGYLVRIPFKIFSSRVIDLSIGLWLTAIKERPDAGAYFLAQILSQWESKVRSQDGLFSPRLAIVDSSFAKMEYLPFSKSEMDHIGNVGHRKIKPHLLLIRFLASHFEATMYRSDHVLKMFTKTFITALKGLRNGSLHPFSRMARLELVDCALNILAVHLSLRSRDVGELMSVILNGALSWFKLPATVPFGGNRLKIKADYKLLQTVASRVAGLPCKQGSSYQSKKLLLLAFLDSEITTIAAWLNPLRPSDPSGRFLQSAVGKSEVLDAFYANPRLAVNLVRRYKLSGLHSMLRDLLLKHPLKALDDPFAVDFLLHSESGSYGKPSKYLLLWAPLPPVDSIKLFMPPFNDDPFILQYTMRSLESHDVNLTFFYVPQIVQALRHDGKLAYVRRFILETAKVSQLFAHQIIWNMLANRYKDEDSEVPDPVKPVLDEIMDAMVKTFSPTDRQFYEEEFKFFSEVTGISGKLKPYIKKSKAEKKAKIDEEMERLVVRPGVYLPSNPDGVVIDINRKSGKPLQSHAKAPFMATFKIRREVQDLESEDETATRSVEQWMSSIFKVGDDCRQDVLALQLISVFRTIWTHAGLDVFVYANRVIATAPGCGIIEVLPNSISRDMLGREAVNGLYEYFISKFGPENSTEFQTARNNFVKSLAAYSVISYLLQFKDRHNGNIMYDDQGHILHIDFGFCFDIVPGGVKFEQAPFKLTKEMVRVMGGDQNTQAYKWFEELCIKAFLACRPYQELIVQCVTPMLECGLPCFKPTTIKKLRARFVPEKTDKEAAIYMQGLIKKSFESTATKGYDEFQRLTNGIPY